MYEDISPTEIAAWRDAGEAWQLIDVREPWELEIVSVPETIRIPMAEIPSRLSELDADQPSRVANIAGGIDAWAQEVDTSLAQY
jgi:rhodanese-related sulfurtransferase